MSRTRWIVLGLIVVTLAALAVVANSRRAPRIGRRGSEELHVGQPVGVNPAPATYRVDYRVEARIGDSVRTSTEKVWVRGPFESRTETWNGAPPGRSRVSTEVETRGRRSVARVNAETSTSEQPPAVAAPALRLDASLVPAMRAGLLQRRERRRVAGRVCQVYRSGSRFNGVSLRPPTNDAFVDNCVDRDGLLLEEVRTARGSNASRRVAVRVDVNPALTDALFAVGAPNLPVPNGGGSTRAVAPTSTPPGQFWQLDALAGFALAGRYGVVPPQPENFADPQREGFRQAGVSDVYVRGTDVVIVDQGATLHAQPPWTVDPANAPVDLGAVGRGEILFTARGGEVRALTGGGRYIRVFGTLPADDLAAIARQLHQVPGGTLQYLD